MKILLRVFSGLVFSGSVYAATSPSCEKWFLDSKLSPSDPDCLLKCGTLGAGMDSFMCPQACPELCTPQPGVLTKVLGRFLYYPGLTPKERKLVNKYPQEALTVFNQKQKAEAATIRVFGRDAQNDESDAFRHFVWAGLLSKELGPDMAKQFLDAHGGAGRSNDPNRAMDLANNRAGLLAAEKLRKGGNLSEDKLEKEALDGIKNKTLVVLEPRSGVDK